MTIFYFTGVDWAMNYHLLFYRCGLGVNDYILFYKCGMGDESEWLYFILQVWTGG
jgi:hypothetical protein